jgi:hypothetical protein
MMDVEEYEERRPLGMTLLTGLYLFFFLVSLSTYGNPFPFMGTIYTGRIAQILVFADSLLCLYLFMGIYKRQLLTWYLLIGYNFFEIVNTIVNLNGISMAELEHVVGTPVSHERFMTNNLMAALAILLLTQYIYRCKHYFTNRQKYLF